MHLQSLGFRTLIDSQTDVARATRARTDRNAAHRRALKQARRDDS
jgi:hypothetical protein